MSGRAQAAAAAGAVPASLPVDGAQICVCRHGETDWNRSGILQGWFDVPLNEHGRQQGHEMAVGFAGADFAALWTSPLARARETAEIIAAELRLAPPSCHDGLRERNFGAVQGIPKDELAQRTVAPSA